MMKLKLSRQEIAEVTGESLSVVADAIAAGHLKTFKVGRRVFAKPAAVQAWVDYLEKQSDKGRPVTYRSREALADRRVSA